MKHLRFCEILQIILPISKRKNNSTGWTKQEATINSIFQAIGIPGKTTEEFYVDSSSCSKYYTGNKPIPQKIRRYIAKEDQEALLDSFAKKILQTSNVSLSTIAKKLYSQATMQEASTDSIEISPVLHQEQVQNLQAYFSQKQYAHYIASTILFSLLYVPNSHQAPKKSVSNSDQLHFNQDLEESIQSGNYYHSYERDVIIYPDLQEKQYKVLTKRYFESLYPNPVHDYTDRFLVEFFYATSQLRANSHFISLKINHINYSDAVQLIDEDLDTDKSAFPFKRTLLVENIKQADSYRVEFQTKYYARFPVRFGTFRLYAPAKRLKVTVRIRTNEKRKLSLTLKNFGSYNKRQANIDRIEPNATMAYFENLDWTLPSSGYAYIVKPWQEFWPEFLPDIEKSTES